MIATMLNILLSYESFLLELFRISVTIIVISQIRVSLLLPYSSLQVGSLLCDTFPSFVRAFFIFKNGLISI